MRLFYFDNEKKGPVLAHAWLPCWIAHNSGILDIVYKSVQEKMGGTSPKEWLDSHPVEADDAAIHAICSCYPYVAGLQRYLEGLAAVDLDATKAPKFMMRNRNGKIV